MCYIAELNMHVMFSFIWRHDVICEVLQEEGFSKIQSKPYEVDPTYTGGINLQAYVDLYDCKVILAYK